MKRPTVYLITGSALLLAAAVLFFVTGSINNSKYRKQLPEPSLSGNMAVPLREQISEAYSRARQKPTSGNIGRLGMVYHSSADYDRAASCYKLAVKRSRSNWVWNYYLGYLSKEMGDNAAVIENFRRVAGKNPDDYLAWFYIAEGYQSLGQNDKAEEIYQKLMREAQPVQGNSSSSRKDFFPVSAYARFQLATIYVNTGKDDLAERTLRDLLTEQPSFGQAYRLLGSIYNRKGDQVAGKKYTARAGDLLIYTPPVDTIVDILARNSKSPVYLLKQIDDAERGGYTRFAAELVSNALNDIPGDKYILSKAVKIYLVMDLEKLAKPLFDKHLESFSSDISELKMVADLCMKKGLYREAVRYYDQAARLQPEDTGVHLSMALCLGNEGAKKEALDSVSLMLRRFPDNLKVLTDGAYVMLMLGEKEKASEILDRLEKKYTPDARVLQLKGILQQQDGKEDQALELFEASFRANPADLATTRYLCDILLKRQQWEKAVNCFRTSIGFNPNDPNLQESLGSLLVFCPDEKLRNISEGLEYSERAFVNKSSSASTMVSAGMSLSRAKFLTGDKKGALETMNTTIQMAEKSDAPQDFVQSLRKQLEEYRD
jgi:tetratricopeptide (TPR) repeat protein